MSEYNSFGKFVIPVFLSAFFIPAFTIASPISAEHPYPFIGNWEHPNGTELLELGDPLLVGATYQLPPNWVMNAYFSIDGLEENTYVAISNRGNSATRTGTFAATISKGFSPGVHKLQMAVYAADVCIFDTTSPCVKDLSTYRSNIVYPKREFPIKPIYDNKAGNDAGVR